MTLPNIYFFFKKRSIIDVEQGLKNTFFPAGNYMLKVNNKNTRTRSETCSKLTIKTPERRQCLYR